MFNQWPIIVFSPELDLLYLGVLVNSLMYLVVYPMWAKSDWNRLVIGDTIAGLGVLTVVLVNYWGSEINIQVFGNIFLSWWVYFILIYFVLDSVFFGVYWWQFLKIDKK